MWDDKAHVNVKRTTHEELELSILPTIRVLGIKLRSDLVASAFTLRAIMMALKYIKAYKTHKTSEP